MLLPNLRGDWVGRAIAGPVGERLGVPVTLVNDVRALTLAELRLGAGRGASDLVCVALGTGVGGGVVIGGRLHLGLGHAGEIGHTTVDPDGPLCGCGNRGCLDRMASAESIAAAAGQPTVQAAADAARAGDAVGDRRVRRAPASTSGARWRARSCCCGPSAWSSAAASPTRASSCSARCATRSAAAPAWRRSTASPSSPPSSARTPAPSAPRCGPPRRRRRRPPR